MEVVIISQESTTKDVKLFSYDFRGHTEGNPCSRESLWLSLLHILRKIKYLSVIIDHRLTWEEHARHVLQKLFTAKGILSKLRHHAHQSVLLNVYYSIV